MKASLKSEEESSASVYFSFRPHASPVPPDDPLDDGEPHAVAFILFADMQSPERHK